MGAINKLLINLFGNKSTKIHSEFGNVIVDTTKEIQKISNEAIQSLIISWCISLPWAYFESLFINENSWNKPLLTMLNDAEIINGTDCAVTTQAFCLWHLEQLISNDVNYGNFSMKEIEQFIIQDINKGAFLIEKLARFRQELQELHPDDWYFKYLHEILNVIYSKEEKISSIINGLYYDSKFRLGLIILSTEMVISAKRAEADKIVE